VREQEQPAADTVRRAIAREEPGVREYESLQRAAATEEPGVREHESFFATRRGPFLLDMSRDTPPNFNRSGDICN